MILGSFFSEFQFQPTNFMALHIQSYIIRLITCKIYKTSYRNLPYVRIVGYTHLQHTQTHKGSFHRLTSTHTKLRDIPQYN